MLIASSCHWEPLKRVHLSEANSQISQKASYQINPLTNIYSSMQLFREFAPVYRCRLLARQQLLQKFSLVPMSDNDRHKQVAEQRTMHRRDVLETKIPVHFPIGKLIICSHSTKIHRQGVSQPKKKRLLIFAEGLHKLLLHCPDLPQNEILMTARFCH